MDTVAFASGNVGKIASVTEAGRWFGITVFHYLPNPELIEIQDPSYAKVAGFKVQQARYQIESPVFCIDGGFEIDGLNGWPGTMTKPTLEQIGAENILWLIERGDSWSGTVRNALAYSDPALSEPICFEDAIPGAILINGRGRIDPKNHWSSFWRYFVPYGTKLTFAELDEDPEAITAWCEIRKRDIGPSIYDQFFTWLQSRHTVAQESG